MNDSWEYCLKRYRYLALTIEELQLWLASSYYHDEPDVFTRVLERLLQVIFDEMIEISRFYLVQNDPENQMLDRKELLSRMHEDLGVIRPDLAKKLAGEYISMRNDLVHNPEQVEAEDVVRLANNLVRDARRFVDGFSRLALCPSCGKMWTYSRTPSVGQPETCDSCGTLLQVVSVSPLQLRPQGAEVAEVLPFGDATLEPDALAPVPMEYEPVEAVASQVRQDETPQPVPASNAGSPIDIDIELQPDVEPPAEETTPLREDGEQVQPEMERPEQPEASPDTAAESPVVSTLETLPEPWLDDFQQALVDYHGRDGARPNYALALSGFRAAAEHGCPYAYRILGVMSRMGQGSPKDNKKARGYFNKGLSKGDKRCLAEMAILLHDEGEGEKARSQWKSYFMSAPFIDNLSYLEPDIDRLYYSAIYLDQVLEQGTEIPLWEKLAPLKDDLLRYYQGLIQADLARKQRVSAGVRQRKLAVFQYWISKNNPVKRAEENVE